MALANFRVTIGATRGSLMLCAINSGPGTRAGSTLLARIVVAQGSIRPRSFFFSAPRSDNMPRMVPRRGLESRDRPLFYARLRVTTCFVLDRKIVVEGKV